MAEEKKNIQDSKESRNEYDMSIANLIVHNFLYAKLLTKILLNLLPNEKRTEVCDNLWGARMKALTEHLMEENRE